MTVSSRYTGTWNRAFGFIEFPSFASREVVFLSHFVVSHSPSSYIRRVCLVAWRAEMMRNLAAFRPTLSQRMNHRVASEKCRLAGAAPNNWLLPLQKI